MLGHWPVIGWLRRATKDARKEKALTLVDVGCGCGDLLRAIRRWARKRDLTIRLIGLDLNRETIRIAQAVTDDADEIGYCVMDVFDFAPPVPIDFVVSSLVTHHMSDDLIVKFAMLALNAHCHPHCEAKQPKARYSLRFRAPRCGSRIEQRERSMFMRRPS
jgi:2-polyprenyl-3-methyl-5-hydroxy-6-metoxy-1,4-benzoquinol methylase